ncbi:DUF1287 domain-containing protein [Candidatus Parcubacteria bacterium]|nr:DUF1287 domain-containing protein [Candidatus Parcubacteria bacterium]
MKKVFSWKIIGFSILSLIFIAFLLWLFFNYYSFAQRITVPELFLKTDQDKDGIDDLHDILEGAKKRVGQTKFYQDQYYMGGYPPENTGVCTDVIWRSFKNAGFDLKEILDNDIKQNPDYYPRVNGDPDPNIDFRRVLNLIPFFQKYAQPLTTKVNSWDTENLYQWQGGDIVIWEKLPSGKMHIGIISNQRRKNGIPYVIHNYGLGTQESNHLLKWPTPIAYHFRFPIPEIK